MSGAGNQNPSLYWLCPAGASSTDKKCNYKNQLSRSDKLYRDVLAVVLASEASKRAAQAAAPTAKAVGVKRARSASGEARTAEPTRDGTG